MNILDPISAIVLVSCSNVKTILLAIANSSHFMATDRGIEVGIFNIIPTNKPTLYSVYLLVDLGIRIAIDLMTMRTVHGRCDVYCLVMT